MPSDPSDRARPDALDVYWRPGCGFCHQLLSHLAGAGITVRRHNIWEDDEARRFVRAHNRGDETVPTVDLAGDVRTNPTPEALVEHVRRAWPHLFREHDQPRACEPSGVEMG